MPVRAPVAVALLAFVAPPVAAQPYRSIYDPPPSGPPSNVAPEIDDGAYLYLAGHLGLNLPVGAIGAELGVGLDWFRGAVSMGRGFRGTSVAGMVRAVKDVDGIDFAIGAGLSRGPALNDLDIALGESSSDPPHDFLVHYADKTKWVDLEVSAELMFSRSGFVRFTLGMTHAFDVACVSVDKRTDAEMGCSAEQEDQLKQNGFLPYFGIAFGARFPAPASNKPRFAAPPSLWNPVVL